MVPKWLTPGSGSIIDFEEPAEWLLAAYPHSGTSFEIIGGFGVAILVIVGATVALDGLRWLRRLAKPIIAVDAMPLTAYVGHFQARSVANARGRGATSGQQSWVPVLLFILAAILFAAVWSRFFRHGPLEYLLNTATKPAKYIR